MYNPETFKIDLKNLAADGERRDYDLDDTYFEAVGGSEVSGGQLHVSVSIRKASGFFELLFHTEGHVNIPCDLCLDDMEQPIGTDNRMVVRLGGEDSREDDVVVVDENDPVVDVAWYIYESVALAIPVRHVHDTGKCNPAMIEVLDEHSSDRSSDAEPTGTIDPRWEKLRSLKV